MVWLLVRLIGAASAEEPVGEVSTDLAEEAGLQFKLGLQAYIAGRYEEALEHLLASNRLAPNRNVLFNIGSAYVELGNYDAAYRHLAEFAAIEPRPELVAEANAMIAQFARKVALVRVDSEPPGASVYVDRKELGSRGRTPMVLALPPGDHRVLLERTGSLPAELVTTAERGAQATLRAELEPILGVVRLQGSPTGAEIRTEDEQVVIGALPASLSLPPGQHVLVITAPGHAPRRELVEVRADQVTERLVDLDVIRGRLVVSAIVSDALIEVDGAAAGFTPAVLDLPLGEHRVRISHPAFRPLEQRVTVTEGSTSLDATLSPLTEVTGASRTLEIIEDAPASISILSQEEIRAFAYVDLYDALAGTRGVFQTNDLTYKFLGFRGFSRQQDYGNRVLTAIDGHTMNDDQIGASYVSNDLMTDLGDLRQIEVVRGPGSALYGSNAFFGVLNLVTHARERPPAPHAEVTGSEGRTLRWRAGGGAGDARRGGWVSVGGLYGRGDSYTFPELAGYSPLSPDGAVADQDENLSSTVAGSTWIDDLTFQFSFNGRIKEYPYPAYQTRPDDPRAEVHDRRGFAEIRYEPSLSPSTRLYSRVYVDHYTFRGQYPYFPRLSVDSWSGWWCGAEPRLVTAPLSWFELTVGAEAKTEIAAEMATRIYRRTPDEFPSAIVLEESPSFSTVSGYALARIGEPALRVHLGARFDTLLLPEGASADTLAAASPRLAVVSRPVGGTTLKAVFGRAFRAPSPYEYLYTDGGNSQVRAELLQPETVWTAEGEWTQRISPTATFVVAAYANQIDDLISTVPVEDGTVFQYANSEEPIRTLGGEAELRHEWSRGWMAAVQSSVQNTGVGEILTGEPITNSPALLGSFKAAAPIVPGALMLASRLVAESPRLTTTVSTPWAAVWDLTATGQVPGLPAFWSLGVRNLLDWEVLHPGEETEPSFPLPQPGRSFLLRIRAELPEQ